LDRACHEWMNFSEINLGHELLPGEALPG